MHLSVVHWCLPHEYNLIRGTGAGSLPQSSHLAQTRSPWSITLADLIKTLDADGDGAVSMTEWLDDIGKCVGLSEAIEAAVQGANSELGTSSETCGAEVPQKPPRKMQHE